MAAIGSIRKHSTLLVIVIGVALAAFVLGDFAKGRGKRDVNVGVVDGEDITIMDFNARYEQYLENTKQQKQTTRLSEAEQATIRTQTWNQMVREILMDEEYKDLGIDVTADELFDMVQGPNPHPLVIQSFTDPNTGRFDRNQVLNYLQNLDNYPPEAKQRWLEFEKYLKEDRLREKFNALFSKAYYIPKPLAIKEYLDTYDVASTEFVAKKISEVPDSAVVLTEEDYIAYYNDNKEKYKKEATRDIKYVEFNVEPSKKDIEKAKKDIISLKKEFAAIDSKEVPRFLKVNSDVPYDSTWKEKGQLPVEIDSVMFVEKPGYVSDYWFSDNKYNVARLMEVAMRPDSMNAAHILIAFKGAYRANQAIDRTREQAQKLADSLYNVIKKYPAKLKDLAKTYSDDPSAKQNDGELGWFKDGMMVPSFNEAVVNTKVGGVTLVESPFGFHIVKVIDKKKPVKKVRVAQLVYEVMPSNETYQNVFAKASKIASEAHTEAEFDKKAKAAGVPVLTQPGIREMTSSIRGYHNVRPIVRWAFKEDTEVGNVSDVFDLDGAYMVAVLTNKTKEGYPDVDEIKPQLERMVLNQKKGEYIAKQMASHGKNVDDIAKAMNLTKHQDNNVTFKGRTIGPFQREYKAIGTLFGLEKGGVSKPVVDRTAVFVLKQIYVSSDLGKAEKNYKREAEKLEQEFSSAINNDAHYRAMEKASDIVDNRIKFF
jgi:peptidyl-prolyl cis-trans isomerase D